MSISVLHSIYVLDPENLFFIAAWICFLWGLLVFFFNNSLLFKAICILGFLISAYTILAFTILGRKPTDTHTFFLFAPFTNEFYRELFMNALLYVPFGLTLTSLVGPVSVFLALGISLLIEALQYFTGTGVAQGSDVIMNTFGAFWGAVPYLVVQRMKRKRT